MRSRNYLFVDLRPEGPWVAVTSAQQAPFVLESLVQLPDLASLKEFASRVDPRSRYVRAVVGVYPPSQLFRHATLDNPSRAREDGFFDDFLKKNYQVELARSSVAILNPATGLAVDFEKVVPKEILLLGASQADLVASQAQLLSHGIYPDRLELASLSTVAGLMHYQRAQQMGGAAVHIQWGPTHSLFSICSGRRLEVSRIINFGTHSLVAQVQKDLHLKDAASAQKVLSTHSFDFQEMGPIILRPLIKELQAAAGHFEVQTGQPLQHFVLTLLPAGLQWVQPILAQYLGLSPLAIDYPGWANTLGLTLRLDKESEGEKEKDENKNKDNDRDKRPISISLSQLTSEHIGLFGLLSGACAPAQ